MKKNYFIVSIIYLCSTLFIGYAVTHSFFSNTGTSSNNTFAASANFPTTPTPTGSLVAGDVVINEINWGGSVASGSADEWLELRNLSSTAVDLTGWKINGAVSGGGDFALSGTLAGNGLFLISNFATNNSAINVVPDLVSTSLQLNNSDVQYKLIDNHNILIDVADDGTGIPLAGSNGTTKASMERNAIPGDGTLSANWHTATTSVNFDAGVTDKGTPKAIND